MSNQMTHYDVISKLIGKVNPVGETTEDGNRMQNLKLMCNIVDRLIYDINVVAKGHEDHRHSVKEAGRFAKQFLQILFEGYSINTNGK